MRDWFGVVTPRGSRLGTSRRQRLLAAGVAFALLLAGFISGSHQAAVMHVRCAHGELTHGDPVAALDAATSTSIASLPGTALPGSHVHEHCLLAGAVHAIAQPRAVAATATAVDAPVVATVALPAIAPRACIYRTAPKTSPPA